MSSTGRDKGPGREDGILLVEQLLTTSFSPALTHLRLYPPALFTHLSKTFLLPPPPRTPTAKFYGVFAPFVQRERREGERLWHTDLDGADGKTRGNQEETVVEVVVRSPGLRKSVERSLDGWRDGKGTCALQELESLRECFAGSALPVIAGDTKVSERAMGGEGSGVSSRSVPSRSLSVTGWLDDRTDWVDGGGGLVVVITSLD